MSTRQPRTTTSTPTQRREEAQVKKCGYCKVKPRRAGSTFCCDACEAKRKAANERSNETRKIKREIDPSYARGRSYLTPEQREAHRRESVKKWNRHKRDIYLAVKPHCQRCGKTLLMCECPPIGAHVAQYRDVVMVLNVATMTRKVEVR